MFSRWLSPRGGKKLVSGCSLILAESRQWWEQVKAKFFVRKGETVVVICLASNRLLNLLLLSELAGVLETLKRQRFLLLVLNQGELPLDWLEDMMKQLPSRGNHRTLWVDERLIDWLELDLIADHIIAFDYRPFPAAVTVVSKKKKVIWLWLEVTRQLVTPEEFNSAREFGRVIMTDYRQTDNHCLAKLAEEIKP